MLVRRVTEQDDFAAIGNIYVQSWRTAYRGIVPDAYLDSLDMDRWAANFRTKVRHAYVLLDGDRYVGCTTICPARDDTMAGWGELVSIYLLPEYYDRGAGQLLLFAAEAGIRELGFDRYYLWTMVENARARRFYEKHGLKTNGDENVITIEGRDIQELRYIKSMQSA